MAGFNGSGQYVLNYNFVTEAASPPIEISKLKVEFDGIATGLSTCVTRDGQSVITADIPFNAKKITGLGDATANADALNRQTGDARYAQLAVANVFIAEQRIAFSTGFWSGYNTGNTIRTGYLQFNATAGAVLLNSDVAANTLLMRTNGGSFNVSNDAGITQALTISSTGAVTTPNLISTEVGYKGAPSRSISTSGNTAITDAGGTIRLTGGSGQTFTLDGDTPVDSFVILVNSSGNSWTIAASGTLTFAGNTGSRTLATGCMAAALHAGSGNWNVAGQLA